MLSTKRILFFTAIIFSLPTVAEPEIYNAPRTAFGQPNLQGTWWSASLTPLERPEKAPSLIIPEANAKAMSQFVLAQFPDNIDPQIPYDNITALNKVRGQYRTSQIVSPENGLLPFTEKGLEWVAWAAHREKYLFDHPEQLAKFERCLGGLGMPPMRMFPVKIPSYIVQTPGHVMIYTEDPGAARIIPLNTSIDANAPRTWKGKSAGYWDNETLVVNTSRFRADKPVRFNIGRALLIGENTTITERFTRLSDTELLYQYTVDDPDFYTQPWSGEFSFTKTDASVYEYSCHEGNYAMEGILRGNQREQAELVKAGGVIPQEPIIH